ncbi:hypothetical protein IJO12_08590 [bacterium]|nr:hypothetical protein [bacterium]
MQILNINNTYNNSKYHSLKKHNEKAVFNGRITQNKMKKFIPEAGNFVFNTYEFDKSVVEKFLKRFSPKLSVNIFSKEQLSEKFCKAEAIVSIGMLPDFRLTNSSLDININIPKSPDFTNRFELYENLIHEMTHIFQADDDNDDESLSKVLINHANENLKNNFTPYTIIDNREDLINVNSIIKNLEFDIFGTLASIGFNNSIPRVPFPHYEESDIVQFLDIEKKMPIHKYLEMKINALMKSRDFNNKELMERSIRAHAGQEKEAYDITNEAVKNIQRITGRTNADAYTMAYNILSKFKF